MGCVCVIATLLDSWHEITCFISVCHLLTSLPFNIVEYISGNQLFCTQLVIE